MTPIKLVQTQVNNLTHVKLNDIDIFFSYQAPVGFLAQGKLVVSENIWTRTTAKHLNTLDPEQDHRVPNAEFTQLLTQAINASTLRAIEKNK